MSTQTCGVESLQSQTHQRATQQGAAPDGLQPPVSLGVVLLARGAVESDNTFLMALDVYIQPEAKMPRIGGDYELVTQFDEDDEGYFVFLSPLFEELRQKTGQAVDLYGDAAFGGAHLDELSDTVTAGKQLLEPQPETWDVWIGTQISPAHQEIYATVHKQELKGMLDKIEAAITKAKSKGSYITFRGD